MMSNLDRLTEYHNGVAVIRDKNKLKEAMEKLAYYEDIEKECDMEKITTEMAEYICDMCCGNLDDVRSQEDADVICDECKLSKFIKDICISYNKLNTFVGNQVEHLLKKEYELKRELKSYKDLEEQGLLLKLPCKVGDTVYIVGTKCLADEEPFEDWCDKHECEECILDKTYTVFERYVSSHLLYTIVAEIDQNFIWGETVFPTLAEAEKALAEMEK